MKDGHKYRNLIYERLWWQITPICVTIFAVCLVGYVVMPDEMAKVGLAAGGFLFLLAGIVALSYASSAYVQCRSRGLRLRYPLYTLDIPYENIEGTRLSTMSRLLQVQIDADRKRKPGWSERKFLGPLMNENVIVIQVRRMPQSRGWLCLWIGQRWLGERSFAVVVREWMPVRREIDDRTNSAQDALRNQLYSGR
ncbi:MAG: hypothetical protein KKA73_15295 [Chloroflexi bacterium]|nr:hypothetical protein [Chloroflexota bacterium]MBU1749049.1 hypothetical protein [Chloroflexota bacterium]MBU1878152.1 hypothetical protein [Chloroflexota bacterium]